jgi:hypothetical protein
MANPHQLHLDTLQLIVRTFLAVFANAGAYLSAAPTPNTSAASRRIAWLVNKPPKDSARVTVR